MFFFNSLSVLIRPSLVCSRIFSLSSTWASDHKWSFHKSPSFQSTPAGYLLLGNRSALDFGLRGFSVFVRLLASTCFVLGRGSGSVCEMMHREFHAVVTPPTPTGECFLQTKTFLSLLKTKFFCVHTKSNAATKTHHFPFVHRCDLEIRGT